MRFVLRTLLHTKPGERDLALDAMKRVIAISDSDSIAKSRFLAATFASDSAADVVVEFEFDSSHFNDYMKLESNLYDNPDFKSANQELVRHLSRAAKTELYQLAE